jgi:hypothetical protein
MNESALKQILRILGLIAIFALSSCGYVSDKPPENIDLYKANQLETCKIDANKLSEILIADQKEQINCLQENFIQFTKYVRTKESGAISETELNAFVKKFFQGQSESIMKGLSLIFQLNMILLKDEAAKISRNNITPLFELLIKVNQEAIIITQTLKEMDQNTKHEDYLILREKFNLSITRFSQGTLEIMQKSKGSSQQLNIKTFIFDATKKLSSKKFDQDAIESLLFIKKLLIGGDKEIITTEELKSLVAKLPKLLTLSFDIYYSKDKIFTTESEKTNFYLMNLREFNTIIEYNQKDPQVISKEELNSLVKNFFPERSDSLAKGLDLIFQTNMVLFKDDAASISRHNLSPLIEFFIVLNTEADIIKTTLKKMNTEQNLETYSSLRSKLNESISRFSKNSLELIQKSQGSSQKLNLKIFIMNAANFFNFKEIGPEMMDSILFVKKLLISGDNEVTTSDEVKSLIMKLPKLFMIGTDLTFSKNKNFENESEKLNFYLINLREFNNILDYSPQNPGAISEAELSSFIKNFFPEKIESANKGLNLIFLANKILFKDDATIISRHNLSPLIEFLIVLNTEANIMTQNLEEIKASQKPDSYSLFRTNFLDSMTRFSQKALELTNKAKGNNQKINIKKFIIDAGNLINSKDLDSEMIDSLLFIKKLIVSGEKEMITSLELNLLISKLPELSNLGLDLYFSNKQVFATDSEKSRFFIIKLRELNKLFNYNQNDFELLTFDQLLSLATKFFPENDLAKFKASLEVLKVKFIGGEKDNFTLQDLKSIIAMAQDYFERNYFNQVTYIANKATLERFEPISFLKQRDLPTEYDLFTPKRVAELHHDFEYTAINIRYFRSKEDGIATYGNVFKRNPKGFLEATLLNWASVKLLSAYGHKNADGIAQVSLLEFQNFLNDMKPLLVELKLWSAYPETFARNAVFLADLFQNKSNGDSNVNLTEATEYLQMIISALSITDKMRNELTTVCDPGIDPKNPAYETNCFNSFFFETILNKLNFKKYFPRLSKYVNETPRSQVIDYLKGVEGFARDIPNPSLPVNKRDNILIIGAMLNIESTFIRFDTNGDNIIDYNELVQAFKVYKPAIISLAKLKDEEYALSVFLYMVSKMEIPPTGSWVDNAVFYTFHKCVTNQDWCPDTILNGIKANRLNIGKLLYYIVTPNPALAKKSK